MTSKFKSSPRTRLPPSQSRFTSCNRLCLDQWSPFWVCLLLSSDSNSCPFKAISLLGFLSCLFPSPTNIPIALKIFRLQNSNPLQQNPNHCVSPELYHVTGSTLANGLLFGYVCSISSDSNSCPFKMISLLGFLFCLFPPPTNILIALKISDLKIAKSSPTFLAKLIFLYSSRTYCWVSLEDN